MISVSLPLLVHQVALSRALRASTLCVLLVHQAASVLHIILNGLPTMKRDPFAFHRFAQLGYGRLDAEPYAHFLHAIYRSFGSSHLLGCQVSNLFFSFALIIQIKLLYRIGCERVAPVLTILFGLPLSCVFNTSVTLREAAQMALFLSLAYVLLLLAQEGASLLTLSIAPTFLGLHYLHHGFTAALALILPFALAWAMKARPVVLVGLLMVSLSGSFFFLENAVERLSEESTAFNQVVSGNFDYVESYAQKVEEGRTDFGVNLDLSSPATIAKTGPLVLFYYLYSPLPWQIRGAMDIYGALEGLLRLTLTFFALKAILNTTGRGRSDLILLAFIFIGMEVAWAAGTANWGTAFRHRLVAWGLLVALGGKGWSLWKPSKHSTSEGSEKVARMTELSVRARRRALTAKRQNREPTPKPRSKRRSPRSSFDSG